MRPQALAADPAPPVACLTDFGLARAIETGSRLTRTGVALGTPAYMSPEQARGEVHGLTAATDVWALGCVAFELLAGRRPFEGENPAAVIAAVMQATPPGLRTLRPDLSADLADVVARALAPMPAARYPDAGGLRADLEAVLRGERPRARGRGRTARLLAVAVALAGAGAAAWWAAGPAPSPTGTSSVLARVSTPPPGAAAATQAWEIRAADPEAAERLLSEALGQEPANGRWRLQRGLVRLALGRNTAAVDDWAAIPEGHPDALAARLYRGLEPFFRLDDEQGPATTTSDELQQAAAGSGREARLAQAALDLAADRLTEASAALRGQEGWEAAYLGALLRLWDPGATHEIRLRALDAALAGGPPFAWAHLARARVRVAGGDDDGGRADLDAAIRLRPDYLDARTNRATLRAMDGDLDGALEDYAAVLAVRPTYAGALLNRALILAEQGRMAEAFADLDRALEAHPDNLAVRGERARLRRTTGDLAGAEADVADALARDPNDPTARLHRAAIHEDAGRWDAALADYDALLAIHPTYATALVNRGRLRLKAGDAAGAVTDLAAALRAAPPDWPPAREVQALLERARALAAGR